MAYKITFISDTHTKHNQLTLDLPGGDILIHAGDISSMGYKHEILNFCKWFDSIRSYEHKIFISGNHDLMFENSPNTAAEIVNQFESIRYLQDSQLTLEFMDKPSIVVYGSPWQPEFCNWGFNLPRNGRELEDVWSKIPTETDLLITHGPAHGKLDRVVGRPDNLGCEKMRDRLLELRPKIHVFGHIHSGNGYHFDGYTHSFNASVLDERYVYSYKPKTIMWDKIGNKIYEYDQS